MMSVKLIKPSFEIIEQDTSELIKMSAYDAQKTRHLINNMYKHIELCGRTCYKSEDKITEESAEPFVDRMIKSKHTAMLEHGTLYLYYKHDYDPEYGWDNNDLDGDCFTLVLSPYSFHNSDYDTHETWITTNYRVVLERFGDNPTKLAEVLSHAVPYSDKFERRVTVKFTCNRQVSHEFVRHRVFSFAQESTRYCNYTKGKFGGELIFIWPIWLGTTTPAELASLRASGIMAEYTLEPGETDFIQQMNQVEKTYTSLIAAGWKPQEAATVLPNALKTELIMTGTVSQWIEFFKLRALGTTGAPHPQAKELAEPLYKEFIERNYIKPIEI